MKLMRVSGGVSQGNAASKAASAPHLVGRATELSRLDEALERVARGEGGALALTGPVGVGRTAVLRAAARLARAQGVTCLESRGGRFERQLPFLAARQALAPLLPKGEALIQWVGAAEPPTSTGLAMGVHELLETVERAAAEHPLALLFDDVHWIDDASAEWLVALLDRLDALPVLLIGTESRAGPAAGFELAAHPAVEVMALGPLARRGTAALLEAVTGRAPPIEAIARVHDACGGHPAYVRMVAATADEPSGAPLERIAAMALGTVRRAHPAAQVLAQALAVFAEPVEVRIAATVAGLELETASRAADALEACAVICEQRPLAFAQPIVRSAIYGRLPTGARSSLHTAAAVALQRDGAPGAAVAFHLLRTEPAGSSAIARTLLEAATEALEDGRADAAASMLRRALHEPPATADRTSILDALVDASTRTGSTVAVTTAAAAVQACAGEPGEARAVGQLARTYLVFGFPEAAIGPVERTLAEPDMVADDDLRRRLIGGAVLAHGARPLPRELADTLGALGAGAGTGQRWIEAAIALRTLLDGSADQAITHATRALDGGALLMEEGPASPVFVAATVALLVAGGSAALSTVEAGLRAVDRTGSVAGRSVLSALRACAQLRIGDLAAAETDAQAALSAATGAWAGAIRLAADVASHLTEEAGPVRSAPDQGTTAGGFAEWFDLLSPASCGERCPGGGAQTWRARAAVRALRAGAGEEAAAEAERAVQAARRFGEPQALGIALTALGTVRGSAGEAQLREAVEVFAPTDARLDRAVALLELGARVRRDGRRSAAQSLLRDALDLAARCGAEHLVTRAREELALAGARPRRCFQTGLESLTNAETRIAELAAQGLSNPEIASVTFTSRKTVECHLQSIYRKLDLRSRKELAITLPMRTA